MEADVFFVAVDGSRKNIVRMMNAALRKFGIQEPITEDDDIETINHKLEVFSGRDGKDIGISDLLEEDGLQELRFIEFVRVEDHIMGQVCLVDRDRDLIRVGGHLCHCVDNTAIVLPVLLRRQHKKSVRQLVHRFFIHRFILSGRSASTSSIIPGLHL